VAAREFQYVVGWRVVILSCPHWGGSFLLLLPECGKRDMSCSHWAYRATPERATCSTNRKKGFPVKIILVVRKVWGNGKWKLLTSYFPRGVASVKCRLLGNFNGPVEIQG
jgi:hypothetical protein